MSLPFTLCLSMLACFIVGCDHLNSSHGAGPRSNRIENQTLHDFNISYEEMWDARDGIEVDKNPFRFFGATGGDWGRMGPQEARIKWDGVGAVQASDVWQWAGGWHSLQGLAREANRTLDFAALYPSFIRRQYQPRIVGLAVRAKGNGKLKFELKGPSDQQLWLEYQPLATESFRDFVFAVDSQKLRQVKLFNWVVESGDISIDSIQLQVEMPEMDIADRVFLKSFAKLAMCFDVQSSLVRDRANWPAGDFDSIPATGMFCLATAAAAELGIVDRSFAEETLKAVHDRVALIPRAHGVLPHFVRRMDEGQYRIHANTEFSTVDTALFQISMLLSAEMLRRSDIAAEVTKQIRGIDFGKLYNADGQISHGIRDDGSTVLDSVWHDWGGETALVLLMERIAMGEAAKLRMSKSGKPHGGVGFIPEIQSLFFSAFDRDDLDALSGRNWRQIRSALLERQQAWFPDDSEAARQGIYGLSAGEGPNGVGYVANGVDVEGAALIHPHYILLSACLHDDSSDPYATLASLEKQGLLPPFGMVENCSSDLQQRLPMLGSLNAGFEAIGAWHLRQKHRGELDTIYKASESSEPLAEAIKIFYP